MAARTERAVLNHLIETCKDGERGFLAAAAHVSDPEIKALFTAMAAQRAQFARHLLPHAQRLGGGDAADGTSAAALHRGWITLKDVLTHHDDRALVREAVRGEMVAVGAFKDALEGMLPPDVRDVVEQQYAEVRCAHDRLQALASPAPA